MHKISDTSNLLDGRNRSLVKLLRLVKMVELNDSKPLDYVRYVFSFLLLAFSLIVTSYAIFEVDTGFWKTIPGAAAFVLFLFDLVVLGIVEGKLFSRNLSCA